MNALNPSLIPLSLYVHWPWCLKKCPYCDFNSHAAADIPEKAYINALLLGLDDELPWAQGRRLESVFIGGGTPSLMSEISVERLLEGIREHFALAEDAEITLEANPGTFEKNKFRSFKESGVTRLSVGVQSFDDLKLKTLGRVHNSDEAKRAASEAGEIFERFNLDLMFGLPGQKLEDVSSEIDTALKFAPEHLSCYQLTLEPNTFFAKFPPPALPGTDELFEMSSLIGHRLSEAGFDHYEVSAYAKKGFRCRHNLNYWSYGDYLAVGAGAHGKVTVNAENSTQILRFMNFRDPALWLSKATEKRPHAALSEICTVEKGEIPFEFMLNALRLKEGVPFTAWGERAPLPWESVAPLWNRLCRRGLAAPVSERIAVTEKGWEFLNDVLEEFLN